MASELRDTGISMVGDVPWGTHFCYFYQTKQDLLDILVPYFKAGLEGNEFCLWIVSNSELISNEEAKAALRQAVPELEQYLSEGRIEIVPHDLWWFLKSRTFDFRQAAQQFKEKLDEALAAGYVGMRVNGSPAWMRPEKHEDLCEFEREVDGIYPDLRIIAACTYPASKSLAELLFDVASSHRFTIARRRGEWDILETPELLQAKQQIERLNAELEQKVIERTKELRESEALMRVLTENANDLIRLQTIDGRRVYASPSVERLYGMLPTTIFENAHPEDLEACHSWWKQIVAGEGGRLEWRVRDRDGNWRWLESSASRFQYKGQPNILTVCRDVTEHIQMRQALQRSESKLREAQRLANIGYWERDLVADRLTLSSETAKIFGLSQREFTHAEMQAMVHPDDRERQERALQDALAGKRRYDNEYRVILPTGKLRFLHVSDEIIYDQSGRPLRMFGAVQDVTVRKQAEEALRRSEENFRKAFDSSPAPAAISRRRDRHVLNVNSAYVRTFGYTAEEAIGKTPDELGVWPDERERQEFWQRVQSETSVKGYETRLRTKSGALIDVLIYSQAIELSGEPCFFTSVIDITERVRAEEQLKTTSEQLRALSSRLQTAREEESKRIAREIHDELGGALTSWRWDLEEIRDAISETIDSSQVTSARMKIDAMIKLTETTLDTVRKLSSELRPMALELGLVEALEWQALQFRERTGIQVDFACSIEKADLENGAATAIFRILQEALTNIQRHAQATKVVIAARQEAGNFILTIKDNGRGISDDVKSAPQSLGLLGMRERAHLVGGEVNIESPEDGGTEITVRIPLTDREVTAGH